MRSQNKLSPKRVASLKEPGRYGDGGGLWLQVTPADGGRVTKAWLFRYRLNYYQSRSGKPTSREMGLGPVTTFSLAEARERARKARQLVKDGIDPIDLKREQRVAAKLERARAVTFEEAATRYIDAHQSAWRNEKHRAQWPATLKTYACPIIGSLPVDKIDTALTLKVLEPIWGQKPDTAKRLRGRIEQVLDWARVRGYREGENPARWKGHLDKLLPAPSKIRPVRHHPALKYDDMPAFIGELRKRDGISARALEFTILTAARTGEVIGASWPEIDFDKKTWTVPAERMKAGVQHVVPLSDRALQSLRALPRERGSSFIFPGGGAGAPLSNMAMLELMKAMRPGFVPHGFRSTFRDWAADCTAYPNHIVEKALAHRVADKVEAAYRRGQLLDKRARLMADWARFCASTPAKKGGNVTAIRQRAKVPA